MSRSGYTEDGPESQEEQWAMICYQGAVKSAIKGKRGQQFLKELLAALDAMPVKELISDELEADGGFCALGVVGSNRGINLKEIDTEDYDLLSKTFNIAPALAREIMYMNDDDYWDIANEKRWLNVRNWVESQIKNEVTA